MGKLIEQILRNVRIDELKLRHAPPVHPSTALATVYERLADESYRGAVVICEEERVVGIFTERDVLYRTALESIDPSTPIAELMVRDPRTLRPDHRLAEAIALMIEGGYRHVPLVDGRDRAVGLLSSREILAFIAEHYPAAVFNLPPRLHQEMPRPEGG